MERNLNIEYNWWCDQGIDIPPAHKESLEEHAFDRIISMIKEGYYSGILSTSVRCGRSVVPEEDEDEGLTYSGSWSLSTGILSEENI